MHDYAGFLQIGSHITFTCINCDGIPKAAVMGQNKFIKNCQSIIPRTLNKGHNTFNLSIKKGQVLWSLQDHGNTILPLKNIKIVPN